MGIIIFFFFLGGGRLLCVFMILPGISWVHWPEWECLETLLSAHRGECDAHARGAGCVGNLLEHRACSVWRETALRRTCRSTRERAGQVTRAKDRPRQPHPASRRGSINHLPSYPSWHAPTLSLCQGGHLQPAAATKTMFGVCP